jgi:hypothetical protein
MATHEDRHMDWALQALADARNHLQARGVVAGSRNQVEAGG